MQKLIKISDIHYIVVDDSEIKEGDLFWINGGHPQNFGIRTCYRIERDMPCWSERNQNWTSETSDRFFIDKTPDRGHGFVERNKSLKITHSTEPIELSTSHINTGKYHFDKIKPLSLSEVEELINGYSVEKMAYDLAFKFIGTDFEQVKYLQHLIIDMFKAHKELVKDKLFTLEDLEWAFMRGALINQRTHNGEQFSFSQERNKDIRFLLPKTEWEVMVDEQGKIKLA